ncbi:uncharacterized protein METZ01_LOCUS216568, partial [marine metagenome]
MAAAPGFQWMDRQVAFSPAWHPERLESGVGWTVR